jgi:hypothetical protein
LRRCNKLNQALSRIADRLTDRAVWPRRIRRSPRSPLNSPKFDIEKSRGGYLVFNRGHSDPIARLRPIPNTDRFELFYWSNVHGGWRTFGSLGRMNLMLESAHDIVENDPMFRIPRAR